MPQVGKDGKMVTTEVRFSEIPANPLHIALYLQDLLNDVKENCKSPSVIVSAVYSIRWGHKRL